MANLLDSLRKILNYEESTGNFVWLIKTGKAYIGKVAGSPDGKGYIKIYAKGKKYQAHRLAWYFCKGEWPKGQIDHINGVKDDNRLANLRDVDQCTNMQNLRGPSKSSTSGYLGVSWNKSSSAWAAAIKTNGKSSHIGIFKTPEEAYAAYLNKKRLLHIGCTI